MPPPRAPVENPYCDGIKMDGGRGWERASHEDWTLMEELVPYTRVGSK